jgi:hypothetical protein
MRKVGGILLATLAITAATGLTASAEPIPDNWCLKPAGIVSGEVPFEGTLSDVPLQVPIGINTFTDLKEVCTGMTATVQKADGSHRTVVPLDLDGGTTYPPSWTKYGFLSVPVAGGAGDWVITKVTWGAKFLDTSVPFRVLRTSTLTLEQPARTSGTARTTITGVLKRYSSTGAQVPSPGRTVRILHQTGDALITTARTDSTGRYRTTVSFTQNTTLRAEAAETTSEGPASTPYVTAHKLLAMSYLTAATTANVNTLWKVSGTAFPGKLYTALESWNGTAWVSAGSAGYTAANGSYARYWKPNKAGTFRLRVVVSGLRLDNSPWNREATVVVRQLPQQPTYLTGTIAPTAGPPVRYETKMSSFGFLKIRRTDGSIGPLANAKVEVLAKRSTDATWYVMGGSTTTSSGYFYNNWYVGFQPGETFTAKLRYTTTLPQAASTTSKIFGPFTVQP